MKTRLRHIVNGTTGEDLGWVLQMWCLGCNARKGRGGLHQVGVLGPAGEPAYGEQWGWDRNLESPTIDPSIAVSQGPGNVVCHSYVRAGRWEFLADSQHPLAGQTVDMVDLPDWLTGDDQ